jgi:hypothetical protein
MIDFYVYYLYYQNHVRLRYSNKSSTRQTNIWRVDYIPYGPGTKTVEAAPSKASVLAPIAPANNLPYIVAPPAEVRSPPANMFP